MARAKFGCTSAPPARWSRCTKAISSKSAPSKAPSREISEYDFCFDFEGKRRKLGKGEMLDKAKTVGDVPQVASPAKPPAPEVEVQAKTGRQGKLEQAWSSREAAHAFAGLPQQSLSFLKNDSRF